MIDQGSSELNIIIGVSNEDFDDAIKAIYDIFVIDTESEKNLPVDFFHEEEAKRIPNVKYILGYKKTLQGIIYRTLQCFLCFLSRFMILTDTNICSIIYLKEKRTFVWRGLW